ncbi:hypothetical protein LM602_04180 [Candidatus Acetothermia bacterium]|jgi:hypothetical protein|nr:hypothetical protein [Candidatus Acetothermia bacterium]MCI2431739.1 hypothetical protein [Candidatus Acetothermia bacterium]MCI2435784.1 hypothetical protein [Candidatus Acetothermia bacterium]
MREYFKKFSVLLAALLVWLSASAVSAQESLLSLYELERGARPAAMGGAFTGLADDAYAVVYNPAALAFLERASVQGMIESRFGRALSGSALAGGRNLGVGLVFLNISQIHWRDENNQPVQNGSFDYSQVGFTIAGGLSLGDLPLGAGLSALSNLAVGLRLKILSTNTLPEGSGAGFSLEPSFFYKLNGGALGGLRLGLVLENLLNLGVTYGSGHRESFPMGIRLGVSLSPMPTATIAADLEANGTLHLGGEYRLTNGALARAGVQQIALRGGLFVNPLLVQVSVGVGVRLRGIQIDYALLTHPELDLTHRFEGSFRFGFQSFLCPLLGRPCPAPEEEIAIVTPPTEEPEDPEDPMERPEEPPIVYCPEDHPLYPVCDDPYDP